MILLTPMPVRKAKRPKWKRTRTPRRLEALSRAMSNAVSADLVSGLQKFKSRINPDKIYRAWLAGDYWKTMEFIPWEELPGDLEEAAQKLGKSVERSTRFGIEALPPPAQERLRFDLHNPAIRRYADRRVGRLVEGITAETREFIANAVSRKFDVAVTPRRVAEMIKPQIGLDRRRARALENYRVGLEQQGMSEARVSSLSEKYENRLLDSRAMTIARTETRNAENAGQQSVWDHAFNQGLISREAKKRWIVDGDPCEVCAPMDGEEVGLNESWTIEYPDGSSAQVMVPTESHPNCMCQMELVAESLGED